MSVQVLALVSCYSSIMYSNETKCEEQLSCFTTEKDRNKNKDDNGHDGAPDLIFLFLSVGGELDCYKTTLDCSRAISRVRDTCSDLSRLK